MKILSQHVSSRKEAYAYGRVLKSKTGEDIKSSSQLNP